MRRQIHLLFFTITATVISYGQQQIPNGNLEEWTHFPGEGMFKSYDEPNGGWSSGNGAIHVAPNADPVCEISTDAHSGAHSAKLTTRRIFTQIASGSLFLGHFELNLSNPRKSARLGMPYTDRPKRFTGYFKYLPAANDSAVLRATLRRWIDTSHVIIGEAKLIVHGRIDEWTSFDLSFVYTSEDSPDTIEVAFAASAGGEFFRGEVGSTLFVDDVKLSNEPVSVTDQPTESPVITWLSDVSCIDINASLLGQHYDVVDIQGCIIASGTATNSRLDMSPLTRGFYVIRFTNSLAHFIR